MCVFVCVCYLSLLFSLPILIGGFSLKFEWLSLSKAHSVGAIEYTDRFSAEG